MSLVKAATDMPFVRFQRPVIQTENIKRQPLIELSCK